MDTERSKTLLPCQENSLSQAEWDIVQLVSDMECERNQQESIPREEPEAEKESDDSVLSVEQVKSLLQEALHHHLGGEKDVKLDDLLEILHQQLVTDHVNRPEDFDSPKETVTADLPHAQPSEVVQVDNGFEDLEHLVLQEASNDGMFEPNEDFDGMASEILHVVGNDLEPEEIGKVMMDHSYSVLTTDFTKHFWKSDHMEIQGAGEEEELDNNCVKVNTNHRKSKRSTPLRRSQRQIDKIDRALVEKIRAENAELQRQEKEEMEKQKALAELARMDCDDISDGKNNNIGVNSQASGVEPLDSRHSSGKKGKTPNQPKESIKKVTSTPNKGKNSKGKNSSYKMTRTFEGEENVQKLNKKLKNENKIHSNSRKNTCSKNNTILQTKVNNTSSVSRRKVLSKDSSFAPKKRGRPMKNISKTNKNIVAKTKLKQRLLLAGKKLHRARSYMDLNTEFDHFKYKQKKSCKVSNSDVKKMPQQSKIDKRKRLKIKNTNGHFRKKFLDSRDDRRKNESLSCSNSQFTESSEGIQSQEPKKIKLQKQEKTVNERKSDNIKKEEELTTICDNKQSLSVHSLLHKEQICNNSKRGEICLASKQGDGSKNGYSIKHSGKMQTDKSEQKEFENLAKCHIQVLLEKIDITLASNKRLYKEVSREQELPKNIETYFEDKHKKGQKLTIHKFKKFKTYKEIINDQKGGEDPGSLGKSKKITKDNVKKEEQNSSTNEQKTEEKEDSVSVDFNQLRLNVRRALKDVLMSRLKNADDILLTSDELKSITLHIEKELYKLHKENVVKYRNVYRALIVNFKDPKNKVLFRKVLKGIIPPDRLVRMSPQDLSFKDDRKRSQQLESPKKQTDQGSLFLQSFGMLIDTTDQHRSHLFDLKCQICTGKVPPPKEESANKKIVSSVEDRTNLDVKHLAKTTTELVQDKCSAVTEQTQNTSLKSVNKDVCLTDSKNLNKIMLDSNEIAVNSVNTESVTSNFPSDINQEKNLHTVVLNSAVEEKRIIEKRETDNSVCSEMKPVEKTSPTFATGVILKTVKANTAKIPSSWGKDLSSSMLLETSITEKQTSHSKLSKTPSWGWKGFIFMEEVARFVNFGYIVSGSKDYVCQDMPNTLYVCGRIAPDQVWSYLWKTKPLATKELIVVSFYPANKEEMVSYSAFYHYLFSRKRLGVIRHTSKMVKDFYILPLPADQPIPSVLLPFNGPGLQNPRPNLLLGLIVRHKSPLKKYSSTPGAVCPLQQMSSPSVNISLKNNSVDTPVSIGKKSSYLVPESPSHNNSPCVKMSSNGSESVRQSEKQTVSQTALTKGKISESLHVTPANASEIKDNTDAPYDPEENDFSYRQELRRQVLHEFNASADETCKFENVKLLENGQDFIAGKCLNVDMIPNFEGKQDTSSEKPLKIGTNESAEFQLKKKTEVVSKIKPLPLEVLESEQNSKTKLNCNVDKVYSPSCASFSKSPKRITDSIIQDNLSSCSVTLSLPKQVLSCTDKKLISETASSSFNPSTRSVASGSCHPIPSLINHSTSSKNENMIHPSTSYSSLFSQTSNTVTQDVFSKYSSTLPPHLHKLMDAINKVAQQVSEKSDNSKPGDKPASKTLNVLKSWIAKKSTNSYTAPKLDYIPKVHHEQKNVDGQPRINSKDFEDIVVAENSRTKSFPAESVGMCDGLCSLQTKHAQEMKSSNSIYSNVWSHGDPLVKTNNYERLTSPNNSLKGPFQTSSQEVMQKNGLLNVSHVETKTKDIWYPHKPPKSRLSISRFLHTERSNSCTSGSVSNEQFSYSYPFDQFYRREVQSSDSFSERTKHRVQDRDYRIAWEHTDRWSHFSREERFNARFRRGYNHNSYR
ncbi:uncharacterized protein LOC143229864 [Tachypleus tridentatus]|uniref:uncharacterized protein LOC143229864 n=1 Tax=Tachypleus tridentatus TaxID=6853 RepID=UPI003FD0A40E